MSHKVTTGSGGSLPSSHVLSRDHGNLNRRKVTVKESTSVWAFIVALFKKLFSCFSCCSSSTEDVVAEPVEDSPVKKAPTSSGKATETVDLARSFSASVKEVTNRKETISPAEPGKQSSKPKASKKPRHKDLEKTVEETQQNKKIGQEPDRIKIWHELSQTLKIPGDLIEDRGQQASLHKTSFFKRIVHRIVGDSSKKSKKLIEDSRTQASIDGGKFFERMLRRNLDAHFDSYENLFKSHGSDFSTEMSALIEDTESVLDQFKNQQERDKINKFLGLVKKAKEYAADNLNPLAQKHSFEQICDKALMELQKLPSEGAALFPLTGKKSENHNFMLLVERINRVLSKLNFEYTVPFA